VSNTVVSKAVVDERPFSPRILRTYPEPRLKLPPGACDCHFHFIGPQEQFPLRPNHVFSHLQFEDTSFDDWERMQAALGLSRGLHVQSMMYGRSYEIVLHAQSRYPDRIRTVVIMPWPGITDRELTILTDNGVVGARLAWRTEKALDRRQIDRLDHFGWSMHYLVRTGEMDPAWGEVILASPGDFVIEHTGYPPPEKGPDSAEFAFVMKCLETGRGWVKLSPRFSAEETFPFADTNPFIRKLVEAAPDRLLWGSDWPHPQYFKPMPNDVGLLDMMLDWVPDEATRRRIFVDNPAELFGFPPAER
jgi:predicted TIM-barrel fold metal-dependent hydrolase